MVIDQENEIFADPAKVHPIHFEGKYFRSRGPLSAPRSPQGRPVICQAGGSARGRSFAARWAETIIASAGSIAAMKEFRNDIRAQAKGFGRNPDHIKVLFMVSPIVDEFESNARARRQAQIDEANAHPDFYLASFPRLTGIDFSKFGMDEVLPELNPTATRRSRQRAAARRRGSCWRRAVGEGCQCGRHAGDGGARDVGPDRRGRRRRLPDHVPGLTRRYISEIADGLTPALQKLGVVRKKYQHTMLREHLLEF